MRNSAPKLKSNFSYLCMYSWKMPRVIITWNTAKYPKILPFPTIYHSRSPQSVSTVRGLPPIFASAPTQLLVYSLLPLFHSHGLSLSNRCLWKCRPLLVFFFYFLFLSPFCFFLSVFFLGLPFTLSLLLFCLLLLLQSSFFLSISFSFLFFPKSIIFSWKWTLPFWMWVI